MRLGPTNAYANANANAYATSQPTVFVLGSCFVHIGCPWPDDPVCHSDLIRRSICAVRWYVT